MVYTPIDDKLLIYEKKDVEKIKAHYGIYTVNPLRSAKIWRLLASYYPAYTKMEKDTYEVYAKGHRHNKFKLLGRVKGIARFKIVRRPIQAIGTGVNFFIRLNKIGLDRGIITKPRPIMCGKALTCAFPPSITKVEVKSDSIDVFWKDPEGIMDRYPDFSELHVYMTLYYNYYAKVEKAQFKDNPELIKKLPSYRKYNDFFIFDFPSKIISVIKIPSKQVFTLKYLILPRDVFIPLKYVARANIKFQMDTIVVAGQYAPITSVLSNIEEVIWVANPDQHLEALNKEFEKLSISTTH